MSIDYEQLYHQYERFLRKICRGFVGHSLDMDDLMQIAYIGLHKAADSFKEDCGASFMHYLALCIKRTLLRELIYAGAHIKIPPHYIGYVQRYKNVRREMTHELLREPFHHELAERLGVSAEKLTEIERVVNLQSVKSIDAPIGCEGEDLTLSSLLPCTDEDMAICYELKELNRLLWQEAQRCLDNDLFELICDYFIQGASYADLATKNDTSLSQIKSSMIRALRHLRNNHKIRQLGKDFGFYGAYRHVTLSEFKYTWTSSVEAEVLKREEHRERVLSGMDLLYGVHTSPEKERNPFANPLDSLIGSAETIDN